MGGWTEFDQWAVGDDGLVLHYRGLDWRAVESPTAHTLYDVVGFSPTDVFMVGAAGTVLGPGLALQPSATSNDLYSLFAYSAINLIAVGANGTIVANDGGGWQPVMSPTSNDLYGVWGLVNGEKVAVGAGGTVIRSNGGPWAVVPAFTSRDLNAGWADSPAIGCGGRRRRDLARRRSGWSPMRRPGRRLYDVFGRQRLCSVGDAARSFHDRIAWRPVAPNPSSHLTPSEQICPISTPAAPARATPCIARTRTSRVRGCSLRYTLFSSYRADRRSRPRLTRHPRAAADVHGGTTARLRAMEWWSFRLWSQGEPRRSSSPLGVVVAGDVGQALRGADGA
jgi:hypothetical protein